LGQKKEVLKLRSVNNIVIAPAKTGKANKSKIVVIKILHTNKDKISNLILIFRIIKIVTIKLIAPKIEETPAKCSEKIVKSTDIPLCEKLLDNGGYTVHPVPAPDSTILDITNNNKDIGNNQNLILFIRG